MKESGKTFTQAKMLWDWRMWEFVRAHLVRIKEMNAVGYDPRVPLLPKPDRTELSYGIIKHESSIFDFDICNSERKSKIYRCSYCGYWETNYPDKSIDCLKCKKKMNEE